MALLIKNGTVVNEDAMFVTDVLVKDGLIVHMAKDITPTESVRVIDATGKYVMPGGIDTHTHMQLEFMGAVAADDFYTGTCAALSGGTTMIIDFVIPSQHETTLLDAYKKWRGWADEKVCCDYALSMAITSWSPQISEEMELVTRPEYGINSFKFFLAYSGVFMVRDDEFFQGMLRCSEIRALARVHAENGSVIKEKQEDLIAKGITGPEGHTQSRPEELEAEATNRACVLASQANCPLYVVHVMSKGAARAISHHRQRGAIVFGEPIAAGLGTDGHHYYDKDWDHAAGHVMSPPLSRDSTTPGALMDLLAAGELHCTGTDNCTFSCEDKRKGVDDFRNIPNGVNGVEDRMAVIWEKGVNTGKLDPMRFVSVTSATAAKIFNVYPKKGRISIGSDADIVIWDPKKSKTIVAEKHHQNVKFNIFEGMKVNGLADITISRGKVVWENDQLTVEKGSGKFIPLPPNSPFVFSSVAARAKASAPRKVERAMPETKSQMDGSINAANGTANGTGKRVPPGGVSSIFS